jgi:HEAT repeat protein
MDLPSVQKNAKINLSRTASGIALAVSTYCTGCMDGPFYELKKLNPVIREQWKKDRERGIPLFHDRLDDYRALQASIRNYTDEEKARYVQLLNDTAKTETSPEIRRNIALTLAQVIDREDALDGVLRLSQDKTEKVRMETAKALRGSGTAKSKDALLAMATADKSNAVKLLAIESLGTHKTDDVKAFLTKQLSAPSPATQHHAILALRDYTGTDLGGDVSKWKKYLNGEEVEPEDASFIANPLKYIWR